ncbi:hypothetical protein BY458DRAFT_545767 [Sporodiniella umbellata]|nr:hypothetical protein BY458DRAFT_545767 [Sporodiniella umbellata]
MSLEESLHDLIENSKRMASVAFCDDDYSPIVSSLLLKQPRLIRKANERESATYSIYSGNQTIESIVSRIPNLKGRPNIKEMKQALELLNELNAICKDKEMQKKINSLSKEIEERETRISNLQAQYATRDAEINALRESIEAEKKRHSAEISDTTHDQEVYDQLQQALKDADQREEKARRRKTEIERELSKQRYQDQSKSSQTEIESLEKQIAQTRRKIKDASLESQRIPIPQLSTEDVFMGLHARLDKLLSENGGSHSASKEALMELLERLSKKLNETMEGVAVMENTKNIVQMFKNVYLQIIMMREKKDNPEFDQEQFEKSFVYNELKDMHKEGSKLQAAILDRLLKIEKEPLNEMTRYMEEYSKLNNLSEKEASQSSLYKLEVAELIELIRTDEETIIKMVEYKEQ